MGNKQSSNDRGDLSRRNVGDVQQATKHVDASGKEKQHVPGEGIRSMKTSNVFRALNFELYAKPSKPIMIFGAVTFSICIGYISYMRYRHHQEFSGQELYESLAEDGTTVLRPRTSRWDS